MKNTYLLQLLNSLSKKELDDLIEFSSSKIHNANNKRLELLKLLMPSHPNFNDNSCSDIELLKKLYPKAKSSSTGAIRRLKKEATLVVEDFLIHLEIKQDEYKYQSSILLLRSFLRKGLYKRFDKKFRELNLELNSDEFELRYAAKKFSSEILYSKFEIETLYEQYLKETREYRKDLIDEGDKIFTSINKKLDEFYLSQKLKYSLLYAYNKTLIEDRVVPIDLPLNFRPPITQKIKQESPPQILIYNLLIEFRETSQDKSKELLEKIKSTISTYSQMINVQELVGIYDLLRNLITSDSVSIASKLKMQFDIIQEMESKKVFEIKGYIKEQTFNSYVVTAIKLHEFEWVRNFIHHNLKKLPVKIQESIEIYYLGAILYYEENYEDAEVYLLKTKIFDSFYYYAIKSLLIRCYFKVNRYLDAEDQVDLMRLKLLRDGNLLTPTQKQGYKYFQKFAKKICAEAIKPKRERKKLILLRIKEEMEEIVDKQEIIINSNALFAELQKLISYSLDKSL